MELCLDDNLCPLHLKASATDSEKLKSFAEVTCAQTPGTQSQCIGTVVRNRVCFDDSPPDTLEFPCSGNMSKLPVGNSNVNRSSPFFADLAACLAAPGISEKLSESLAEEDLAEFGYGPRNIHQLAKLFTWKINAIWPCGPSWEVSLQACLVVSFCGFHESSWTAIGNGNRNAINSLCAELGEVIGDRLIDYGIEYESEKVKRVSTGFIADTDFAEFCGQAVVDCWGVGAGNDVM